MPTWPSSLPQSPLKNGFSRALGNGVVRSQPEHGPQQIRRRFTAVEDTLTAQYQMTEAQWENLVTFYKITTAGGSLAFDWPDPYKSGAVSVTFEQPPEIRSVLGNGEVRVAIKLREQPS